MAKEKKEKEEAKTSSKDILESILKETQEDHFAFVDVENQVISTSSLILDSLVKVYSGQIIRLCAKGAELGKTSQSFVFAENYMKTMPNSKTIYIKCEARLSKEIQNRSGLKFVTKTEDWEYGTVFVYPCNIFETIASTLEKLLKKMHEDGEHLCIVWDSLDHAILRSDMEKDVWGEKDKIKVAGVPLLTKLLFRRLGLPIDYYGALMIVTSQYTAEIKLDPYSKEPPRQNSGSGGSSINHMSSYTFTYGPRYQKDLILERPDDPIDYAKNKIIGVYATIEITKSGTDVSGTKVKIPIKKNRSGCAIWQEKEIVDLMISFGFIEKKGAWFNFSSVLLAEAKEAGIELKEKLQGLVSVYDYMEEEREVFNWLYNKFNNLVN